MGLFDKIFGTNDKIEVQFIDNFNGETIGVSEIPVDQLPETFTVSTNVKVLENDWTVEEAIPANSTEFIKSKKLILKVRKIETINISDIWATLPTIEYTFTNLVTQSPFNDYTIKIHGDDWLQQEFISAENSAEIDTIIEQIRESAKDQEDADGRIIYKKCFARQFPTAKINDTIYLNDIQEEFKVDKIGGLGFSNFNGYAENTFVIEALGTYFYGQLNEDNSLRSFAIYDIGCVTETERLESIARKLKLNFVDWTGMYQIK